ncbi:MAG: site-2 protease family protein [Planctomycetota bacterium]
MSEKLFRHRLPLGSYAGIPLYVHWSFSLVVIYVGLATFQGGAGAMAFSIAQLFGLFFCVTLHEYGHALAAKWFGIETHDITLLPIGGVARLVRMPRAPHREFVVAVAGPAVNGVIAIASGIAIAWVVDPDIFEAIAAYFAALFWGSPPPELLQGILELSSQPSAFAYLVFIFVMNLALVIFNMIPAFPMDGGRVLRAMFATVMSYGTATWWASRIGLGLSFLMVFVGLQFDPIAWQLVFVAVFIGIVGTNVNRQVQLGELTSGIKVQDVMGTAPPTVGIDASMVAIAARWKEFPSGGIPVLSPAGGLIGVLTLKDVLAFSRSIKNQGNAPESAVGQWIDHERSVTALRADDELSNAIMGLGSASGFPVVDADQHLVGWLDASDLNQRIAYFRMNEDTTGKAQTPMSSFQSSA